MLSPIAFDAANGRWDLFYGPPRYGDPPTTKAPYNNAGLSFNVGGDHSLGPQGGPYGRSTIITRMASY